VEEREALRASRVEQINDVLKNPRGSGLTVHALFPLLDGNLPVEVVGVGQWVFGDRVGGLTARPALEGPRRARDNKCFGEWAAGGVRPRSAIEAGDGALEELGL